MGSGRAKDELTSGAKKPRERRRREKNKKKRLNALGVPESALAKMSTKKIRELLIRPERTKRLWAGKQ